MNEQAHSKSHSPLPYLLTLIALLILTGVTVAASYVNFGSSTVNVIVAMLIATFKASLVALVFMHLRQRVYPTGLRQVDPPPGAAKTAPAPAAPAPAHH